MELSRYFLKSAKGKNSNSKYAYEYVYTRVGCFKSFEPDYNIVFVYIVISNKGFIWLFNYKILLKY